jgi:hypothetical protein
MGFCPNNLPDPFLDGELVFQGASFRCVSRSVCLLVHQPNPARSHPSSEYPCHTAFSSGIKTVWPTIFQGQG